MYLARRRREKFGILGHNYASPPPSNVPIRQLGGEA